MTATSLSHITIISLKLSHFLKIILNMTIQNRPKFFTRSENAPKRSVLRGPEMSLKISRFGVVLTLDGKKKKPNARTSRRTCAPF